ncbi:FeoA family protein [Clostridium aminobutyricum]|uniref:Ferrous iron transport protein A n=1 Tax=Clostridium aminobutyricum TaxID=33953 RepID=A0A939IK78_CLOAM|nr:FeoA family protein [Clostridium aminobutyricum]MBN7774358.1 ferrous iron transport protein A [Clostridium aminobutyricum]
MKENLHATKKANALCDLKKGQFGCVNGLDSSEGMNRRLQDIGLIEGTTVECVQLSPGGELAAYLVRGAVMALRTEDAAKVYINKM